jgi:hypothetical protein
MFENILKITKKSSKFIRVQLITQDFEKIIKFVKCENFTHINKMTFSSNNKL